MYLFSLLVKMKTVLRLREQIKRPNKKGNDRATFHDDNFRNVNEHLQHDVMLSVCTAAISL